MAAISTILTAVGAAVSAYGMIQQHDAAKKSQAAAQAQADAMQQSAAEQRQQFAAQQRIADIRNARERADLARKARIARGQVANEGAANNVLTSSGVVGGIASISSQENAQLGTFSAIQSNQGDIISSQMRQATDAAAAGQAQAAGVQAGAQMAIGQGVFGLGSDIFKAGGGWKTIFDTTKPQSG